MRETRRTPTQCPSTRFHREQTWVWSDGRAATQEYEAAWPWMEVDRRGQSWTDVDGAGQTADDELLERDGHEMVTKQQ